MYDYFMTPEQEKQWLQAIQETAHIVDGRGMPIDPGILETVTAMRLLGAHTYMSCEGHMERGFGPYVACEAPNADADRKQLVALRKKNNLPDKDDPEIVQLSHKMNREERLERLRILLYLNEFYETRNPPHLHRLSLENVGFLAMVLRCQGGAILVKDTGVESAGYRREMLARHQQEMRDFTEFLKTKFCEGYGPKKIEGLDLRV